MGIVASQSLRNIISTYLGFFVGAINTLFLYTKFLSDDYYGVVCYMLSLAYVIMPLMSFGMYNTLIKFYSTFKTNDSLNRFLTFTLVLPFVIIIPLVLIVYVNYDAIANFLANNENTIIHDYLWHAVIIAIALAYFEIFFSWAKVQMQTVLGNFMKEVFHRVGAMILLFLLYFKIIQLEQFMAGLVIIYTVRMLIMNMYAFIVKPPVLIFRKITQIPNLRNILKYSFLIIIAGSIATILLDVDKVMIGHYIKIETVAYYSVAIYIASVIAVPQRSMHQILSPLSAKYLNEKDYDALKDLYKRSSLNLFLVGGFIFLLIVLNINELYKIIPEKYSGGLFVVFMISLVKLYENVLGSNNAILFNSDYYRIVLVLGVFLVILTISLNIVFIPILGANGAGLATFLAVFIYNTIKLFFVYKKFKMLPFTKTTLKITILLITAVLIFYFWEFPFHPVINIGLKSILITMFYGFIMYRFNFSEDISILIKKYLKLN